MKVLTRPGASTGWQLYLLSEWDTSEATSLELKNGESEHYLGIVILDLQMPAELHHRNKLLSLQSLWTSRLLQIQPVEYRV